MPSSNLTVKVDLTDMVHPDRLQPNTWNTNVVSPENEARIEESMKRLGFFKPIIVRTLEDGSLEILGGEHRWQIAKKRGMELVPIFNLGTVPDSKAKEIGLADNGRYGEDDALQLADLLKELGTPEELGKFLPYSDSELNHLLSASSIAMQDLDMPAGGPTPEIPSKPAPTHQIMRFKVPVEDAAWGTAVLEKIMREQNFTSDDSMTNAGNALVYLLNKERNAS
jgi:ParB-like chromosome segregation protein Spo0J